MAFCGILNVNKPAGITSRRAVDLVERLVRPAKVGHAGTLDPLATGVLVICVGQATRLIRFVQRMPKRYRATFLLGYRSETDDIEGEVFEVESPFVPRREELERVVSNFVGEIKQRPPVHSAVKVGGRRAYKLARRGEIPDLAARTVYVHNLQVHHYEYPALELEIECGGGTYVRSIGRDLAAAMGTSAVMSALERTAIGPFHIEDSVDVKALDSVMLFARILPPESAVVGLPLVMLTDEQLAELGFGRPVPRPTSLPDGSEWSAVDSGGKLRAIVSEKQAGRLWPEINF